jgi:tetratricopeptide (TPR) repeat protein
MKKAIFTILLAAISSIAFAQKQNITSAAILLKQYSSEKDTSVQTLKIKEAKEFIDQAFANESTSNEPKMWNYRAPIYLQIALKKPSLDEDAILKATEAHIKCLQKDEKGRIIVRKWTEEEDVLSGLINCGFLLFKYAIDKYDAQDYTGALKYYNAIFDIIPFDTEGQLKKGNITKETVLYNSFFASRDMKDNAKSKELLQQLMDIDFNKPAIYVNMSNIYLEEKNNDKALEYLASGRKIFKGDQSLITTEINLFIKLGRTSELIEKLGEAIALDSGNALLYFNRGTIYDQEGDFLNAEKDYIASLERNPNAFDANYNLGALYFNEGASTKNKANETSNNKLFEKLKKEADACFTKALPFLEIAYKLNAKDRNTLLALKQLYYFKEDYPKSEEMKKQIEELK